MPASHVEIDTRRLNRILRNLDNNTDRAVRAVAFEIERKAKIQIQLMKAIDTGALLNSVYTKTYNAILRSGGVSSETAIFSAVRARRPAAEIVSLPQPGRHEAHVGPSVGYALAVHYGTNRMAGRPYLDNAVREVERDMARHFGVVCTDE